MPNCFQLFLIGDETRTPQKFTDVDTALCLHFGVPEDPKLYYYGWYDWIGFGLACGSSWEKLREIASDERSKEIVDWFERNYRSTAWYEPKGMR